MVELQAEPHRPQTMPLFFTSSHIHKSEALAVSAYMYEYFERGLEDQELAL
jgi:hypothetical protein